MNDWKPRYIFWDLDGTLVYWESLLLIKEIAKKYLQLVSREFHPLKAFLGTARAYSRVLKNTSTKTNDALFNATLAASLKISPTKVKNFFKKLMSDGELDEIIKTRIRAIPHALHLFEEMSSIGGFYHAGATNPVMPAEFNRRRLALAGFDTNRFFHITGSEFYSRQKKDPVFFQELLNLLRISPSNCLMIGNDVKKDLVASTVGIPCFLIENEFTKLSKDSNIKPDWSGDYAKLRNYLLHGFPGNFP